MKKRNWLRPLLALGAVSVLVGWWQRRRPRLRRLPVAPAGGPLVVQGERFGSRQGSSQLQVRLESGWQALEILSWSEARVVARLPEGTSSGVVRLRRVDGAGPRVSEPFGFTCVQPALTGGPYGYQVPVQPDSPWPTFRRDHRNSGRSPLLGLYQEGDPWSFKTGKGIFSTPVIDAAGDVYFGSADHVFYALHADGSLKWQYRTGEVIDSAAAIGLPDPHNGISPVTFISGDGNMYQVRSDSGAMVWKFEAELRPEVSFNRWFEGNVAAGFDGTLYAGNSNFLYYAINPDGTLKWRYPTGSNNWSLAAFGEDGTVYWGSCDTHVHAVSPSGQRRWTLRTLGFIAASAAIGSDGSLYIGSFDSRLYALEPHSGRVKWRFDTHDHIYASVGLGSDERGETNCIYLASTDGWLYALRPQDGELRWRFFAGDPIRSSPAVGLSPEGKEIVYFGCGDGRLYAVNGSDGSMRWSYDTTPDDPELRDRNDLNGSPALGKSGVLIGGEHGCLWHLPYDYPLHHPEDGRGRAGSPALVRSARPAPQPHALAELFYVSPGGSTRPHFPEKLPPGALITLRLQAQRYGEPFPARLQAGLGGARRPEVFFSPPVEAQVEVSADGCYLHIRPLDFLQPGARFRLHVSSPYYSSRLRLGNLTLVGSQEGRVEQQFEFEVEALQQNTFPLQIADQRVGAVEWTRLAAPLPAMLPSLNQIGFDYLDWVLAPIYQQPADETGRSRLVLWAVGARRDASGLHIDPQADLLLPLSGETLGDTFIVSNHNFRLPITGIDIPFRLFELRGRLAEGGIVAPGASTYAETQVLSIPGFGWKMALAGLANEIAKKMVVAGTYVTRPYPPGGPANRRPQGVHLRHLFYQPPSAAADGSLSARFSASVENSRRPALVLVDAGTLQAVPLDYARLLQIKNDPAGGAAEVSLHLPRRTKLPDQLLVVVVVDVFPLYCQELPSGGGEIEFPDQGDEA